MENSVINRDGMLCVGSMFEGVINELYAESNDFYYLNSLCGYNFLHPNVRDDTVNNSISLKVRSAIFLPKEKSRFKKYKERIVGIEHQSGFIIFLMDNICDVSLDYPKYFLGITRKKDLGMSEFDYFDFRILSDSDKQNILFRDPHILIYVDEVCGIGSFKSKIIGCTLKDNFASNIVKAISSSNRYIEYIGDELFLRKNADKEIANIFYEILSSESF